jgi:hypothetical protein
MELEKNKMSILKRFLLSIGFRKHVLLRLIVLYLYPYLVLYIRNFFNTNHENVRKNQLRIYH